MCYSDIFHVLLTWLFKYCMHLLCMFRFFVSRWKRCNNLSANTAQEMYIRRWEMKDLRLGPIVRVAEAPRKSVDPGFELGRRSFFT